LSITIDAMGGDHAPRAVVAGAALAVQQGGVDPTELVLVGPEDALAPIVRDQGIDGLTIVHAPQVVAMDESPAAAVRTKPESSIVVGVKHVAKGPGQAFVSAGNTGAVVAAASLILGRLSGIARPGIAVPMPTREGPCVVIDVGANIYCKPNHMLQYGIMAVEYSRCVLGKQDPLIGLLNIGEEDGKGNPLIQEVHGLLRGAPVRYHGFIEGQDITSGAVDVVVCEGFVGNVILKVAEGMAAFVGRAVSSALALHPPRDEVKTALDEAFAQLDYAEYGGAPLLGVNAPVLIGHGRSSPHAIMNMILAAQAAVAHDVNRHIVERMASVTGGATP
jgi:glycerol-3-phosphate acyltransferase PlsX